MKSGRLLFVPLLVAAVAPAAAQKNAASPEELLERGREAFLNYDFAAATKHFADYRARIRRLKVDADEEADRLERWNANAARQLGRVQEIVVIDSIDVPAMDFFRNIRIPASAGYLLQAREIPFRDSAEAASMAYVPESGSLMLWSQPDSLGVYRVVESARLTDGSFSQPVYAPDFLNAGGDVDFPTLSADGLTLYFSSDGEESIGGYDIFETVRDPQTGEYLPPSNVGMPFNSPYDDFLLVTDEQNGVGWWATDRNQTEDKITLYVYMLPEARVNFEGDDDERVARARISDYRATWLLGSEDTNDTETDAEDAAEEVNPAGVVDYEALAREIRQIRPGERPRPDEFRLPLRGGRILTHYDQLDNAAERNAVRAYERDREEFENMEAEVARLRREYDRNPSATLGSTIAEKEKALSSRREQLRKRLSDIYRILSPS